MTGVPPPASTSTAAEPWKDGATATEDIAQTQPPSQQILPLAVCQSLSDLEQVALAKLSPRARTYYESGAETHSSLHSNSASWSRLRFRPRVLRDVRKVAMRCTIMGQSSSLPVFIAPTAAAKLGHPDGELCLTRGAVRMDIPQILSTYATVTPADVARCFREDPHRRGGALFYQLYLPKVKAGARELIAAAKGLGFQTLVVTIDQPVIGKRDADDRLKATLGYDESSALSTSAAYLPALPGQEPGIPRGSHASNVEWTDLPWIRECWGDSPIILKGIQTVDDALEATRHDVDGIYLSNHGGRALDYAPTTLDTLLEIRKQAPDLFNKLDVYVDGGVRRGTDVVKALCLGAKAVGIGRGFVYALSAYGANGVVRAIESE